MLVNMHSRSLRKVLLAALTAAGCGGATPLTQTEGPDGGPSRTIVTSDGGQLVLTAPFICSDNVLDALRPALGLDFLERRELPRSADGGVSAHRIIATSGQACASAANRSSCLTALDPLPTTESGLPFLASNRASQGPEYLVATRGDQAFLLFTRDDVLRFVGTVDSPGKALLIVYSITGYRPRCDSPGWGRETDSGWQIFAEECGGTPYLIHVKRDGSIIPTRIVDGENHAICGRRPEGLAWEAAGLEGHALGCHLAASAALEAASVHAFAILARELQLHGAPRSLRQSAMRARADEVRHARMTTRLAKRHGLRPARPHVARRGPRSLAAVALENMVEGCVREAYGALEAEHQALHAADPEVRRTMAAIADDETRHAALSFRIDAWAKTRLSPAERAHLVRAKRDAIRTLKEERRCPRDPELCHLAGLPSPDKALRLIEHLEASLWAELDA